MSNVYDGLVGRVDRLVNCIDPFGLPDWKSAGFARPSELVIAIHAALTEVELDLAHHKARMTDLEDCERRLWDAIEQIEAVLPDLADIVDLGDDRRSRAS